MPKNTVKLVSAEGFEFIIDYKAACVSNTIRNMLSSQGGFIYLQRLRDEAIWRPSKCAVLIRGFWFCFRCDTGSFTETELGEVKFPEISTPILEKTIQYFYYKLRYQNS